MTIILTIFACLICSISLITACALTIRGIWEPVTLEKDIILRYMALAFIAFLFILINESNSELFQILLKRFSGSP